MIPFPAIKLIFFLLSALSGKWIRMLEHKVTFCWPRRKKSLKADEFLKNYARNRKRRRLSRQPGRNTRAVYNELCDPNVIIGRLDPHRGRYQRLT